MRCTHRFQVKAPLSQVAAFHRQPASLGAITPPPVRVVLHQSPTSPSGEGLMDFTLWFGPLPLHWTARLEALSETGFTDRQLRGPFAEWVHRHTFTPLDACTTQVADQITFRFRFHPVWGCVGLAFALGLPALFAYRAWKTRRLLEKGMPLC